jgi:hypothetical protein
MMCSYLSQSQGRSLDRGSDNSQPPIIFLSRFLEGILAASRIWPSQNDDATHKTNEQQKQEIVGEEIIARPCRRVPGVALVYGANGCHHQSRGKVAVMAKAASHARGVALRKRVGKGRKWTRSTNSILVCCVSSSNATSLVTPKGVPI